MDLIFKIISGTLISIVIGLILVKQGKDLWAVLSICVCCMILMAGVQYLKPIISFLEHLQKIGDIDQQIYQILLKTVGIGVLAEITALLCSDSGNTALGKCIYLVSAIAILWLSLPLLEEFTVLIETILETI